MNTNEYLAAVVEQQSIKKGSDELSKLKNKRDEVEDLLRDEYGVKPSIIYGGSRAKHTMIVESYDLDILIYFPHDEELAGESLEDIYNNVAKVLSDDYYVKKKQTALRLHDLEDQETDFHIDVVPGRYVDASEEDVFLHQNSGDKERLKTNPNIQINHIRESGVRDAIKLMKYWNVLKNVDLKTFVLELLVVKILKRNKDSTLKYQLDKLLKKFKAESDNLSVKDPANEDGNDLTPVLDRHRDILESKAANTLRTIENDDWQSVFGEVQASNATRDKSEALKEAAAVSSTKSKPWCRE